MLALKNDYSTFSRKTDAKIKLLKDVLDRVQRGEDVDVEKALGTGDEVQEQEWKDGKFPRLLSRKFMGSSCVNFSVAAPRRRSANVATQGTQRAEKAAGEGAGSRSR